MKKLELTYVEEILGGEASTSFRAGFTCGASVGLSILGGVLTGGAALIPLLAGAAAPACGLGIYAMYQ